MALPLQSQALLLCLVSLRGAARESKRMAAEHAFVCFVPEAISKDGEKIPLKLSLAFKRDVETGSERMMMEDLVQVSF